TRTLQYYDKIDLLKPTEYTKSGYRLYDDAALEKLQQILLFRELEFPLKNIKDIVTRSDFDTNKALEQQIELLELKKEHIDNLLNLCRYIKMRGVRYLNFKAFDSSKLDEYSKKAKEQWEHTPAYKEFSEKSKNWTKEYESELMADFYNLFEEFGKMKDIDPAAKEAQEQVKRVQDFITENMYTCSNEILYGLSQWYVGGGDVTQNIDEIGGKGTAEFVYKAIKIYCGK
nr:MerR family transcriptional regulator [Lachnospiraceae bacterium]